MGGLRVGGFSLSARFLYLSTRSELPSPAPPHKGEGLTALRRFALIHCRYWKRGVRRDGAAANPSPLWGGVGEGFSATGWVIL
ncbi:hypothetical protein AB395_00004839 (plasmid) [Sinorhizobium fredii CCBAU 45436]|nr:hypothetical protein AB395_00004839 [Sinorhizobium fredii CCBAU 45436]